MGNLVIVAIPSEDDRVWKVSSEKKPHLTLLYLGDSNNPNRGQIAQFLLHATNVCLTRFGLDVDRRGELGDDKADVLFFEDIWGLPQLKEFRHHLLQDETIRKAYEANDQFPEWQPHLTLGYPKKPAKDEAIEFPIRYVDFDRVALWDSDYEGVELILKREKYSISEVSMSGMGISVNEALQNMDLATKVGVSVKEVLSHHGVKGMRWGVRKDQPSGPTKVGVKLDSTQKKTKKKIQTSGGERQPAHKDAIDAAKTNQKVKKSGPASASNKELQDLARRLQLEQQVKALQVQQKPAAQRFVSQLLGNSGKQQAQAVANKGAAAGVAKIMAKGALAAA